MLRRRVLIRHLVRVSAGTRVLRRVLRRGGWCYRRRFRRQRHALSQSTTPFACTLSNSHFGGFPIEPTFGIPVSYAAPIGAFFCPEIHRVRHWPKERRRRRAEKRLSKRVFLESPFFSAPLRCVLKNTWKVLKTLRGQSRNGLSSPKTPFWTTFSPHDAFAAPLAHPQIRAFTGFFGDRDRGGSNLRKLEGGWKLWISRAPEIDPFLQRFYRKSSIWGPKVQVIEGQLSGRVPPPPLAFVTFWPPPHPGLQVLGRDFFNCFQSP